MKFLPRVINIENIADAVRQMAALDVHQDGINIMKDKAVFRAVKIKNISVTAANILKQNMLSRGGEVATSYETINHGGKNTDVILLGTLAQYKSLISRLQNQQFKLPLVASEISKALDNHELKPAAILGMEFGSRTYIMGILNITPDSFSDGGDYLNTEAAIARAKEMIDAGADIIDVGGESTRPGAQKVPIDVEISRVIPVIQELKKHIDSLVIEQGDFRPFISIDTRKAKVADAALNAGASMINDVSGLRFDPEMASVAAKYNCPVVIMHSKGNPDTMQHDPKYDDIIPELLTWFDESLTIATDAGIDPENIILDPGIGFGKRFQDNIEIIRQLTEFKTFGRPVLLGTSRKAFLGEILGGKNALDRDIATGATLALAIAKKVDIIRVHNISIGKEISAVADTIIRRNH